MLSLSGRVKTQSSPGVQAFGSDWAWAECEGPSGMPGKNGRDMLATAEVLSKGAYCQQPQFGIGVFLSFT